MTNQTARRSLVLSLYTSLLPVCDVSQAKEMPHQIRPLRSGQGDHGCLAILSDGGTRPCIPLRRSKRARRPVGHGLDHEMIQARTHLGEVAQKLPRPRPFEQVRRFGVDTSPRELRCHLLEALAQPLRPGPALALLVTIRLQNSPDDLVFAASTGLRYEFKRPLLYGVELDAPLLLAEGRVRFLVRVSPFLLVLMRGRYHFLRVLQAILYVQMTTEDDNVCTCNRQRNCIWHLCIATFKEIRKNTYP